MNELLQQALKISEKVCSRVLLSKMNTNVIDTFILYFQHVEQSHPPCKAQNEWPILNIT
jgi:hypothetical protein